MKRIILPVAAIVLFCTGLFSCANNEEMNTTDVDSVSTETTMPAATPELPDTVATPPAVDPGMDTTNRNTTPPTPAR